MALTIGVDVGGTKIAAGVVAEDGRLLDERRTETPADDATATEHAIVALVDDLRRDHDVEAVGIGAAGYVDADRATVLFTPNLAWRNAPVRDDLESRVQLPVVVENDANAAAWGEFRFGAGADVDDLLLVAVGTGVGGGIVIKGELMRGSFGVAAEIGHFRVVPRGLPCGCGQRGCWEQYASGTALVREAKRRVAAGEAGAKPLLDASGGDLDEINGPAITSQAQQDDPFCIDLLAGLGTWLGEGIASLTTVLDSGVVVIGGGVGEAGELLLGPVRQAFTSTLPAAEHRPHLQLRLATLGNEAGMIGVADLARSAC
ncbi:MAG: ROK family glucokinase [Nocardioidaceae bacterium]|nr:ROK family glucokinase [Nocardioidaceae bacterium]